MAEEKKKTVEMEKAPEKAPEKVAKLPAWKAPFPEAKMDANGADTVLVRAVPTQDIRINGTLLAAGSVVVLPCSVAHAHAAALSAPKE